MKYLDGLINISPIHSFVCGFLFFFSSCVFFGVYVRISLKSWEFFCQTVGGLGRSPVRGFFGLFNDMGLFWGCLSGFLCLLLRCQSWLVLDFAAISGVYL